MSSVCPAVYKLSILAFFRHIKGCVCVRRQKAGEKKGTPQPVELKKKKKNAGRGRLAYFHDPCFFPSSVVGSSSAFHLLFFFVCGEEQTSCLGSLALLRSCSWFMPVNLPAYPRPLPAFFVGLFVCISRFCLGRERIKDRDKRLKAENMRPLQCKTYPAHDEVAKKKTFQLLTQRSQNK